MKRSDTGDSRTIINTQNGFETETTSRRGALRLAALCAAALGASPALGKADDLAPPERSLDQVRADIRRIVPPCPEPTKPLADMEQWEVMEFGQARLLWAWGAINAMNKAVFL